MGTFITLTRAPFCIKSPKRNPPFLRGEDFSGFFPKLFPGVITTATSVTAIVTITTAAIIATAIGSTLIRVKAFLFKETFQKVSINTSL